ncbi:hypothetical protein Tco_1477234 [Tanacetum coccineum]
MFITQSLRYVVLKWSCKFTGAPVSGIFKTSFLAQFSVTLLRFESLGLVPVNLFSKIKFEPFGYLDDIFPCLHEEGSFFKKLDQLCRDTQLTHYGLLGQEDTADRDRLSSISVLSIGCLNVLPGAFLTQLITPHNQSLIGGHGVYLMTG